jgi:cyclophilin family peptidyl-prolyl cis-trans isomerase/outer membrane murein-binding lipoprotein Lpp
MSNKIFILAGVIFAVVMLAGCSNAGEVKKAAEQPINDAANYVPGMVDINRKAQEDVNSAVNKENERLNNTLNENNMGNEDLSKKYSAAVLKTSLGDIKVKFDPTNAPNTVNNFLKLASEKFYDGTKFHRVIKGFMIQGGDPMSKDNAAKDRWGTGGPGYKFADELKGTEKYPQGTLAMANSGPNTNGSQFFIVTASPQAPLPASYTVFGSVVSGIEVALKIENVKTIGPPTDRPVEDVVINSVELLEK